MPPRDTLEVILTPDELEWCRSQADRSGMSLDAWSRWAILRIDNLPIESGHLIGQDSGTLATGDDNNDGCSTSRNGRKITRKPMPFGCSTSRDEPECQSQLVEGDDLPTSGGSTSRDPFSARERPPARATTNKTVNSETSLSLRSKQPGGLTPTQADSDSPWPQPKPMKNKVHLPDAGPVSNTWLWANALRLSPNDVEVLLTTPQHKQYRNAMLKGMSQALRNVYVMKWCQAHRKRTNQWRDTTRSTGAFLRAARFLAEEYATRGMTPDQFIDAANEMRPKNLKFVTCDMLGGVTGEKVHSWVPEEQREPDKPWRVREDRDGRQWVHLPGETEPYLRVRSQADREYLKQQSNKSH